MTEQPTLDGIVPPLPEAAAERASGAGILSDLRADLRLQRGAVPGEGGPAPWLLYDPIAHRYYELDAAGLAFLRAWRGGEQTQHLADRAGNALGREVPIAEAAAFRAFAEAHGLAPAPGGWRQRAQRARAGRHGIGQWLLHNYLFIRIPLVRPQRFLDATLPLAHRAADRRVLLGIAGAGMLGLYLAAEQWDAFTATFLHFLTPEGILGYLLALACVKVLHELGHAYTAVHHGCRVPSMGVAFMIMVPVLYTDTTDAWRVRDRRGRVAIAAAGIAVEIAVAALATLAWSFLPEGVPRSVAFFLATTSWVMSLAINLSPLMRFDGYYIATDLSGISNLQPRAFALTRWMLRETLFGLRDPCPETWSPERRAAVIAYGVAVWIYRLVLFTGIAIMVYAMAFKILGLLLFAVEIGVFIVRPIVGEVTFWWSARGRIESRGRVLITGCALAVFGLLLFLPVSSAIEIPAIAEPGRTLRLSLSTPARVEAVAVRAGTAVSAGEVLIRLASPQLDHEVAAARIRLALIDLRLDRRTADAQDRASSVVLDGQREAEREIIAGLQRRSDELTIRAPFDGVVAEILPDLHEGRWIGRGENLGTLVADGRRRIRGLVSGDSVARIDSAALGTFVPDDPTAASMRVEVTTVSMAGIATVDIPELASTLGGPVAAREEKGVGPVPVEAQYEVVLDRPDDVLRLPGSPEVVRGLATVSGRRESLAGQAARRLAAIFVRESGF